MKAILLYKHKAKIKDRFILHMDIFEIGKSSIYPDGIKYSFVCYDLKTGRKILMDNHNPKGHHIHIDEKEIFYEYKNDESLINDFKKIVFDNLEVIL